jgi:ABC-type antimicrobial peptide transport system permease subunit
MRNAYSFYFDAAKIALQSIFAHKLRAFLTLIGIIIGVASVVVVGASIEGLNVYMVDTISKLLGANHFMIARIAHVGNMTQEEWEKMMKRNKRLDWDDLDWLINQCGRIPDNSGGLSIKSKRFCGVSAASSSMKRTISISPPPIASSSSSTVSPRWSGWSRSRSPA